MGELIDMDMDVKLKNVILRKYNVTKKGISEGLEITHRKEENNECYMSLVGTKAQINSYLQDKPVLSDRLRTLNNVPKYRMINSVKYRIY
jgi:hypothetical protein